MAPLWTVVIAGAVLLVLGFKDFRKNKGEE